MAPRASRPTPTTHFRANAGPKPTGRLHFAVPSRLARIHFFPGGTAMKTLLATMLLSALLAISAGLAWGAAFLPVDFDQLVADAEQIFLGTVTAVQSRKVPNGAIVTDVTFASPQVLKGSDTGAITLLVLGGTVGEETLALSGVPTFQLGVRYLVFAKENGKAMFPVVGGDQGLFQIQRDAVTGEETVWNAQGMPITSKTVLDALGGPVSPSQDALLSPSPVRLDAIVQATRDRLGSR